MTEPWRIAMTAKLETDDVQNLYTMRKQTVEPVFGIIKAATEWTPIALAYNCRRLHRLQAT